MKGTDVADFLRRNAYTRSSFLGVFPIDRLPTEIARHPCSLVINTGSAVSVGEHWTALYIDSGGVGYYWDSLGPLPVHDNVVDFVNRHTVKCERNYRSVQSVFSDKCGYYCLYFLYKKAQGASMNSLLRPFSTYRLVQNDVWVTRWYYRHRPVPGSSWWG